MKTRTKVDRMELTTPVAPVAAVAVSAPALPKAKFLLYLDPAQIAAVDQVWHKKQLKSRAEAVRMLLDTGLRAVANGR